MGKQETLETIWEVPDELWERIEPIILEEDPPKARGRKPGTAICQRRNRLPKQLGAGVLSWGRASAEWGSALTHDRCSTASSSGCAAGANGTDCRKSLGTTAPFIAPFNGGWGRASCTECGEPWWRGAKSWMAWTGNGRRQTEPWARHVLGGPDWAQPYGPWQGWYQAQSPCGWRGRPLEHCGCGSKRARCQAVGGDRTGRHCGRTTTAHRGGTPTPVSGQRV